MSVQPSCPRKHQTTVHHSNANTSSTHTQTHAFSRWEGSRGIGKEESRAKLLADLCSASTAPTTVHHKCTLLSWSAHGDIWWKGLNSICTIECLPIWHVVAFSAITLKWYLSEHACWKLGRYMCLSLWVLDEEWGNFVQVVTYCHVCVSLKYISNSSNISCRVFFFHLKFTLVLL